MRGFFRLVMYNDDAGKNTVPTVLEDGPYLFIFFSSDKGEPPHIHVKRERRITKFWLDP